ncbi:MAG: hypothetical protein MUE53_00815 [Chitinophagales bacterium]|jgi:cell division protein FtsB|nr:hypothetical protein [Chitinophagales bacterium]
MKHHINLYEIYQRLKVKYWFFNKYVLVSFIALIYMLFIDNNDLINQYNRIDQIAELNQQIDYYKKALEKSNVEYKALQKDVAYQEKILREKYLLKKKDEDLFIFKEK